MNKSKSHSKKTSIPNTLRIVDGDTIHIGKKKFYIKNYMKKYSTKNLPKKISNLLLLKKKFLVPKFYFYLFAKYKINKKEILNKVRKEFTNVIIRSAYSEEDQDGLSNAGKFLSIPNIKSIDALKLDLSINKVVNSYKMQNPQNQYFLDSNVDTHNKLNQLLNVQKFFKPFSYKGSNF